MLLQSELPKPYSNYPVRLFQQFPICHEVRPSQHFFPRFQIDPEVNFDPLKTVNGTSKKAL